MKLDNKATSEMILTIDKSTLSSSGAPAKSLEKSSDGFESMEQQAIEALRYDIDEDREKKIKSLEVSLKLSRLREAKLEKKIRKIKKLIKAVL